MEEEQKQAISDMYGVITQILTNYYNLSEYFKRYYLLRLQNTKTNFIQRELTSYIVSLYFQLKDYDSLKNNKEIKLFFEFIKKKLLNDKRDILNYEGLLYGIGKITTAIKILGLTNIELIREVTGKETPNY